MSIPPDIMQAILSGGLMSTAQQPQSGLLGAINQALAPYGGSSNVALGLLANRSGATNPMAAIGQGLYDSQQTNLKNQSQQIQNAQGMIGLNQSMQSQALFNQAMQRYMANQQGGQPQGTPAPMGGAPPSQQGAPPSVQSGAPPSQPQDISQIPINGIPPDLYRALAMRRPNYDPVATEKEIRDYQTATAQRQVKPQVAALDTVINSADPVTPIKANPAFARIWQQGAQQVGLDPTDLSDPAKVRVGLNAGRNQLAAYAQLEPAKAPVKQEQIEGPLGQRLSRDPSTGEIKQEVAPQETAQFITPQGVRMLTKAEGIAKGYQPFNATLFGAANMTDQSKEMAYQYYLQHQALPTGFARSPVMQADMMNYIAQRAKQEGNTQTSILANAQLLKARGTAEKSFAPGGQDYKTVQFLNTAVAHLDTMKELAGALNNNAPMQVLNRIKNSVSTEFGGTAPTNAAAAAQIVGAEVTKAIVANGGSAAEREEASNAFSNAKTWDQLQGVADTYTQLLGGQLETRRNSYEQTFGRKDFDTKFLTPRTRKALGIPEAQQAPGLDVGQAQTVGSFTVRRVK